MYLIPFYPHHDALEDVCREWFACSLGLPLNPRFRIPSVALPASDTCLSWKGTSLRISGPRARGLPAKWLFRVASRRCDLAEEKRQKQIGSYHPTGKMSFAVKVILLNIGWFLKSKRIAWSKILKTWCLTFLEWYIFSVPAVLGKMKRWCLSVLIHVHSSYIFLSSFKRISFLTVSQRSSVAFLFRNISPFRKGASYSPKVIRTQKWCNKSSNRSQMALFGGDGGSLSHRKYLRLYCRTIIWKY